VRLHRFLVSLAAVLAATPRAGPAQDSASAADKVFAAEELDEHPTVLSRPPLEYPDSLRHAGIEGRILLRVIVDTLGRPDPTSLQVLESADSGLVAAAKEFALGTTFRPGRRHGQAVRSWVKLPVVFDVVPPLPRGVYRERQVDVKPQMIVLPRLTYPPQLFEQGVQGRVIVGAIIDSTGRVDPSSVTVLKSPNSDFDDVCIDYVLHARYRPGKLGGRSVSVFMRIPIDFKIRH
jgi:TonB family protein